MFRVRISFLRLLLQLVPLFDLCTALVPLSLCASTTCQSPRVQGNGGGTCASRWHPCHLARTCQSSRPSVLGCLRASKKYCDKENEKRPGRERRRARSWKSEGSLKLTRGEIEAGLTYARKNLAHFSKQVAFVDCDLSHLDRVGGGGSKVCVDIWVQRIAGSEFFLRSEVAGSLRRECDRCLEAYDETFQGGFHLMLASRKQMVDLARRRADEPDDQDGARNKESKQATADEAIVDFSPDVRLVDVSQEVREAVGGAISLKALCSQSCRGLCYSCGANLNVCGHAASEGSGLQQCAQCCAAGKGARGKGGEAGERAAASGGTLLTQTKSRGGGGGRGVGGALSAGALAGLLKLKSDLEDKQGGS